ncbi:MAG: hypothetical protein ACPLZD_05920 [Candidatus Saccharicenans sp.]|nr:MAG: hypothetical protein C0168_05450 [Candidatus Aminicenantes bacterium]HEK85771.1 hypothetical protein [Candidatus Aminicenantes bacterium]
MNDYSYYSFGSNFERAFIGLISVISGIILVYLAIMGPLVKGAIKYKTAEVINNQLVGQDLVNLLVLPRFWPLTPWAG